MEKTSSNSNSSNDSRSNNNNNIKRSINRSILIKKKNFKSNNYPEVSKEKSTCIIQNKVLRF